MNNTFKRGYLAAIEDLQKWVEVSRGAQNEADMTSFDRKRDSILCSIKTFLGERWIEGLDKEDDEFHLHFKATRYPEP